VREEPVQLRIDAFQWDENNISHLHDSATVQMIDEARDNDPILLPNRPGHAATHVMIGITDSGLHLYVPMLQISPGLWRPITAWRSREAYQMWNKYRG
jgi:hypothetical protein